MLGQLGNHFMCAESGMLTSTISSFSHLTSIAYSKVFLDTNWADLGVPGKVWMFSFQKIKEIEIPMVGLKVTASGSVLTCSTWFWRYLNHFNSDFDPRIVVGKGNRSKLGFLVPLRVNLMSNLVKVNKNLQVAWVWCRNMKIVVLEWFWLIFDFRST